MMRAFVTMLCIAALAPAAEPDPRVLAARIDKHLAERMKADGVTPAVRAGDAEFLRRVTLDITGRIPAPRDVHEFLADTDPHKRERLIDELLETPQHAVHFTNVWRGLLLPELLGGNEGRIFQQGFESWLNDRMRRNVAYDVWVRELLAAPISVDADAPTLVLQRPEAMNELGYFAMKEANPANLAAGATRVFLGIQIECAQCHDHPFARWSRDQFWNQAAFFAGIEKQGEGTFAPLSEKRERRSIKIPETAKTVQAMFLDGTAPAWNAPVSPRELLANWMTRPDNPYFARTAVNRLWGHFFGIGIVDPVDDFNDDNKPSHPELLDELSKAFADAKFDQRFIMRALCRTEAYQRTSAGSASDRRHFARMTVKGLSAEQFHASFVQATGLGKNDRPRFLTQFAVQGKLSDPETSILQALTLMNGKLADAATSMSKSPTLRAIVGMPGLSIEERIEAIYLTTLARKPSPAELTRVRKHVGDDAEGKLGDVMWALLNSAEFRLNH